MSLSSRRLSASMVSICLSCASVSRPVLTRKGLSGSLAFRRRSRVETILPPSKKTTATSSPAVSLRTPDFCWTAMSWRISGRLKSSRLPCRAMSGSPEFSVATARGPGVPRGERDELRNPRRRRGEVARHGGGVRDEEEKDERNALGQSGAPEGKHVQGGHECSVRHDEGRRGGHDEDRRESREAGPTQDRAASR